MLKLLEVEDDARNDAFETLIGQAKKHCEAAQQKQKVPAYEDIIKKADTYIGNCNKATVARCGWNTPGLSTIVAQTAAARGRDGRAAG